MKFLLFFPQFQPSFPNRNIYIVIILWTRIKSRSCYLFPYLFPYFPILPERNHCFLATFTHYKLRNSCKFGKAIWYSLDSQKFPLLFEGVTEPQKPVYLSCTPRKRFKITKVNGIAMSHWATVHLKYWGRSQSLTQDQWNEWRFENTRS